jgi:hypothetical protein
MNKRKIKILLDFIPLLILTASSVWLVASTFTDGTVLLWKHYLALALLPVNFALFAWRHKAGVLGLGLTLLIGLVGLISYTPFIAFSKASIGFDDVHVPVFAGNPIFLLWLIIHFVFSARHYVGIASKKYWECLRKNEEYVQPHLQY